MNVEEDLDKQIQKFVPNVQNNIYVFVKCTQKPVRV